MRDVGSGDVLPCSKQPHQCPTVGRLFGGVTTARSRLQSAAVDHCDIPAAIADQIAILQRTGRPGDADSVVAH